MQERAARLAGASSISGSSSSKSSLVAFTIRVSPDDLRSIREQAKAEGIATSVLARDRLLGALHEREARDPRQFLRAIAIELRRLRVRVERVDLNVYNSVVYGLSLVAGTEQPADSAKWAREILRTPEGE